MNNLYNASYFLIQAKGINSGKTSYLMYGKGISFAERHYAKEFSTLKEAYNRLKFIKKSRCAKFKIEFKIIEVHHSEEEVFLENLDKQKYIKWNTV